MKAKMTVIAGLALSSLIALSANAATTAVKVKAAKKAAAATEATTAAAATTSATATSASLTSTTTATSTNTSTTTLGAVGAAPSKLGLSLISENWVGSEGANARDYTGLMSQNNVDVSYKLAEGKTVDVKQYFLHNMTYRPNENTWGAGDLALQYTDTTKLLNLGSKIGLAPTMMRARLYLPVSHASQDIGAYELRLYGTVTQTAGKYVNIEYGINPRIYAYTINGDGQKGFRVLPSISFSSAKEDALFVPYVELSTDHMWLNSGKGLSTSPYSVGIYKANDKNIDLANVDVGTNINVNKNFSIQAFYEEEYNLREADQLTSPEHDLSSYNLNLTVSM